MQRLSCLNRIREQGDRIDQFSDTGLTQLHYERMYHAATLYGHLLELVEDLYCPIAYVESRIQELTAEIDSLFDIADATINHNGILVQLTPRSMGFKCMMTDSLGNDVVWFVYANTTTQAKAKVERHLNSAVHYFRGMITLEDFLGRVQGG